MVMSATMGIGIKSMFKDLRLEVETLECTFNGFNALVHPFVFPFCSHGTCMIFNGSLWINLGFKLDLNLDPPWSWRQT